MPLIEFFLPKTPAAFTAFANHEFNKRLLAGTLPADAFTWFVKNDAWYLGQYAIALKNISTRTHDRLMSTQFHDFSAYIELCERKLHQRYLGQQANAQGFFRTSPVCPPLELQEYAAHLHASTRRANIDVAIAAVTPCFTMYAHLAKQLKQAPNTVFSPWIKSYSSPAFLGRAKLMGDIYANTRQRSGLQAEMEQAFRMSAQCEIGFCNAALRYAQRHQPKPIQIAQPRMSNS